MSHVQKPSADNNTSY
jgi:hypothetical protein